MVLFTSTKSVTCIPETCFKPISPVFFAEILACIVLKICLKPSIVLFRFQLWLLSFLYSLVWDVQNVIVELSLEVESVADL